MSHSLDAELDALPTALTRRLDDHHFDRSRLVQLSRSLASASAASNRVEGEVAPPDERAFLTLPEPGTAEEQRLRGVGEQALRDGQVALVVLAGGMATRMGGVVKALVEALPGRTFLDLRLEEQRSLEKLAGRPVPLWLMTSAATDSAIRQALGPRLNGTSLAAFPQRLGLRLTPEGALFRDAAGSPSEYAPGHGDLVDSLRDSGLLSAFVARGGKVLTMANLDNLGATLDPVLIGLHLEGGRPVTGEVVDKAEGDRGGIPVRHGGRTVVLEEFRLPEGFDAGQVRVFNTNTFHFDAKALESLDATWSYFVVTKKVDGRPAVQLERLVGELTSFLDTAYVRVPRSGARSRFLPVKDHDELAARKGDILAVARSRGMVP